MNTNLRGHFDGTHVVLDDPPPPELKPNTPVQVRLLTEREEAHRAMTEFLNELWAKNSPVVSQGRIWKREDLYDRGRKDIP